MNHEPVNKIQISKNSGSRSKDALICYAKVRQITITNIH